MNSVGELREDVGRLGAALEAGQRGPAIGGEVLVAFGMAFLPVAITVVTSAYGVFSPYAYVSPLAGLAAFLSFLFLARTSSLAKRLALAALIALVGQVAWFAAMQGVLGLADEGARTTSAIVLMSLPIATLVLVLLGSALAISRLRHAPGALAPGNRAIIACWLAIVAALAVLIVSFAVTGVALSNYFGFALLPSVVLAMWGAGWAASSWISGRKWMHLVAAGSFLLAFYYAGTMDVYGALIVALSLLVLTPGIKLLRDAGADAEAGDEA